ncbi:uncharacterized protein [Oscarella lobularis]|uniref:uncharacterized protein isoform X2 n=1 Tax=Oscarella lobularis TaxID=121494 RepID=UPI00331445E1
MNVDDDTSIEGYKRIENLLQKANVAVCFESFDIVLTHGVQFSHLDSAFVLNQTETKGEAPLISFSSEAAAGSPFLLSSDALREDPNAVKRLFSVIDDSRALVEMAEKLDAAGSNEGQVEVIFASDLIKPLVGYCYPSKHGNKAHLYKETDLELKDLGMGEKRCWHGHGDLLASPTPHFGSTFITTTSKSLLDSQGEACPDQKHLNQAIGQTIMYSFVHHNLHPEQQSLVPGVLLSRSSFWVLLYDCVADVLLVSDSVPLFISDSTVLTRAIAVLWLVLHHKLFLNKNAVTEDARQKYESGFLREAKSQKTLRYYKREKSYTKKRFVPVESEMPKGPVKRKAFEGPCFEKSPHKK